MIFNLRYFQDLKGKNPRDFETCNIVAVNNNRRLKTLYSMTTCPK